MLYHHDELIYGGVNSVELHVYPCIIQANLELIPKMVLPLIFLCSAATSSNANDGERCNDRHDQGPSSPHVPLHPSSPSSLSKPSPLHFIYLGLWGSKTPPATFAANFKRFQEQNTERKVVLWTDAMVEELVQTHLTKEQLLLYRISVRIVCSLYVVLVTLFAQRGLLRCSHCTVLGIKNVISARKQVCRNVPPQPPSSPMLPYI